MDTAKIENEVRTFVANRFLFGRTQELQDDVSLLGNVIDSVGALELLAFLQDRFGISLEDEELLPENFDSIASIVAYLTKKNASSKA